MDLSVSRFYSLQSSELRYQYTLNTLYQRLKANHCIIGKFINDAKQVKTLQYLQDNQIKENFVYDLVHTPCFDAKELDCVCAYESGLQALYPQDELLKSLDIHGYLGVTLRAPDHKPIGILVCMFKEPMTLSEADKLWFSEIGCIVATELSHNLEMSAKELILKQLANGERIAKLSSWTWYITPNEHWFSQEMCSLLNCNNNDVSLENFLSHLRSDDSKRVAEQLELIKQEKIDKFDKFDMLVCHKQMTTTQGLFHIVGEVEFSADHVHERILRATVQDITYTSSLSRQVELTNVVFENASEAFMITDHRNKIMMVNRAFELQTGYSAAELYGEDPGILSSGKQTKQFYKQMWQQLEKIGIWKGEIYNRRKNGQVFPEELTLNAVKGEDGKISNYVAIFRDITDWKRNEAQLTFYANHEALTGLLNRRSFMLSLEKQLTKSYRLHDTSLLFLGLDRFKEVNDIFGPEIGDKVLIAVADRLLNTLKRKDIASRYGGDEFALLIAHHSLPEVMAHAQWLKQMLSEPYHIDELTIELSVSIGVAHLKATEQLSGSNLVKNAAHALSNAKKQGRSRVAVHDEAIQNAYLKKIKLRDKLKAALRAGTLQVHYQPVVSTNTGKIAKFEALIRWFDDEYGAISPACFIPIAEEFGLIHLIGQYVLETSCRDLAMLHQAGFKHISFSINRSINEFKASNNQVELIPAAIERYGLPYDAITIEVTESMAANKYTWQVLEALSELGVQIALDDFCTGYSSLSNLIENQVDFVKIDKSFVDCMGVDRNKQVMVKCLVDLSSQLGIKVIAEGVEQQEQQQMLSDFGCHLVQGYIYSPARPILECLHMLEHNGNVAVCV
ncbi:putative bifunctional diguanylate cyclase/phosphodiesterase [Pseudoalteromonas sp. S16_S37]|uniref:putative bifunctional diguanylate cyclase/phosphodiesterase n=1 Tax=Pseudoalteromonas sp. S16_S37 TaxID=2720228 RepID=UPI0016808692|nr:bifunctional diguanylate cyclase/phosphodiesterase [Pseudoalteromonas sp. S16_S37]MBD1582619.1 EAL domain-containing protein [Pseudoalteromonas sp. S16_S37]